jgi:cell division protein FtsQ
MLGARKRRVSATPMATARGTKRGAPSQRARLLALLALATVLIGGSGWLISRAPRLLTCSPRFQLQALEVNGLRVLAGREILAASGLQVGDNVFMTDLAQVRGNLEALPWVRAAEIHRRPPDRLVVRILERRRVAWVDLGKVYGVDVDCVVLPGRREGVESVRELDLPVISGLDCVADSLQPGAVVADSTLAFLVDWWQQASAVDADFCLNVSEIQPLGTSALRLRLVGDGLEVRLPRDRVRQRIRILRELMKRVYRECPAPAYIDMRFAGQVVVGSKEQSS